MRLCPPVSLCLAVAAVLLPAPVPALAHAEAGPSCAGPDAGDFPLTTRLRGGPDSYRAGGGFGTWYLDLTNTTRRTCDGVHPVVVLVDARRALKPSQPHLEFYADGRPHPVRFEATDDAELVGAFTDENADVQADEAAEADDFPGFTVGPGRTVTVKLRLALGSDAVRNTVTANAAVVQRHGDDGDWIGQSNDYRFTVESDANPDATPDPDPDLDPDPDGDAATAPTSTPTSAPDSSPRTPTPTTATPPTPHPSATDTGPFSLADQAEELARTGLASPTVLAAAAGACFLAAGAALLLARRLARRRR
ncbi:hypothetical protein SAMN04487983_1004164 [Streptomyces sp. yr375]|uniref:hypothetical protein n=1 Tax=Streptomyces sp. yr375 TaxID=1761906 RepID=UPI0008CB7FDC|nr:hypothetical protein [Streptomyces sp. yr375]SEQ32888.1 hypothetical protein SAMN04487983_1004164 [Streptomyces sp. yr375]